MVDGLANIKPVNPALPSSHVPLCLLLCIYISSLCVFDWLNLLKPLFSLEKLTPVPELCTAWPLRLMIGPMFYLKWEQKAAGLWPRLALGETRHWCFVLGLKLKHSCGALVRRWGASSGGRRRRRNTLASLCGAAAAAAAGRLTRLHSPSPTRSDPAKNRPLRGC